MVFFDHIDATTKDLYYTHIEREIERARHTKGRYPESVYYERSPLYIRFAFGKSALWQYYLLALPVDLLGFLLSGYTAAFIIHFFVDLRAVLKSPSLMALMDILTVAIFPFYCVYIRPRLAPPCAHFYLFCFQQVKKCVTIDLA